MEVDDEDDVEVEDEGMELWHVHFALIEERPS